ncbi:M20 family metallopeptidase [Aspergillus fijiensis CBS 313.89]|uniref:Peptidase M20 domain-containing protein 2 n=1 Tax=Aspergillus fijiensis CBS 313.89 TaxID=1448319 RepID=A0A8G1RXR4_9EURO|nr:uncharacterized protein BO72DRAFT_518435 [Aspergillus fijiensis CBS 313.89]RAK81159.1 hypothetical protein BO72DRAFT_518435 [Aspergillus fijiensis CBS 313.89]
MTAAPLTAVPPEEVRTAIDSALEKVASQLRQLNHLIWSNPELAYEEHQAHDAICNFLEKQGFTVTRHAYGVDTSFECISGTEGRLVNLNAEYDALPGIGHACGHNLIATSSIAAFLALSHLQRQYGIGGRIQLLGTPAEENGGGKARLIDAGAYKGVDVSLMADGVAGILMNARKELFVEYFGKNAHAGGNPWEGVNALDALIMAYNGISTLRQQILPDERIHGAFLDVPKVANVIPAYTKSYWQIRSPTLDQLNKLIARVRLCIEGAAVVTGCTVKIVEEGLYTDIVLNDVLCQRYTKHMAACGRSIIEKYEKVLTGSSDVGTGNVSYVAPTLHSMFAIPAPDGCFPHHPSFTACAGTDEAHEEAIAVGKGLALLGWDMLSDEKLLTRAKSQWKSRLPTKCDE